MNERHERMADYAFYRICIGVALLVAIAVWAALFPLIDDDTYPLHIEVGQHEVSTPSTLSALQCNQWEQCESVCGGDKGRVRARALRAAVRPLS